MEHYITDEMYNQLETESSIELVLAEKVLWKMLSELIEESQYLPVEEKLYEVFSMVEKEYFYHGFKEGIRFLLKCL
ncbi:MAG: hypothetical protein IJE60_09540 [Tyzzerella sp.]|nr:hypothetical protein [Tyzzerella sp.]